VALASVRRRLCCSDAPRRGSIGITLGCLQPLLSGGVFQLGMLYGGARWASCGAGDPGKKGARAERAAQARRLSSTASSDAFCLGYPWFYLWCGSHRLWIRATGTRSTCGTRGAAAQRTAPRPPLHDRPAHTARCDHKGWTGACAHSGNGRRTARAGRMPPKGQWFRAEPFKGLLRSTDSNAPRLRLLHHSPPLAGCVSLERRPSALPSDAPFSVVPHA
jgi:hypothetical protein